jgi:hypothetical protein
MMHSGIIPMDNKSQNFLNQIKEIHERLKPDCNMKVVVVLDVVFDVDSADYTARPVEGYAGCIGTQGGRRILPFTWPF